MNSGLVDGVHVIVEPGESPPQPAAASNRAKTMKGRDFDFINHSLLILPGAALPAEISQSYAQGLRTGRHMHRLSDIFVCLLETRKVGGIAPWHRSRSLSGPTDRTASRLPKALSNWWTSTATSSTSQANPHSRFAAVAARLTSPSATERTARSAFRAPS